MENRVRNEIESHRFLMQLLVSINGFVICEIDPYLELLNHLTKKKIAYRIVEIVGVSREWSSYLKVLFSKSPYKSHNFLKANYEFDKANSIIAEFRNSFPSNQNFQYGSNVSQIPNFSTSSETFKHIVMNMYLAEQKVYVYYFKYALVIEVSLNQLLNADGDVLFNSKRENVVVCSIDFVWVIAYEHANLWFSGYKKSRRNR